MARSTKQKSNNTDKSTIDLKSLEKMGFTTLQNSTLASVEDVIPTLLPQVDSQIAGGMPFGRVVELYSTPGAGKSTIAIQLTRVANQLDIPIIWMDIEATASREHLGEMGVDLSKTIVWTPEEGNPEATAIQNIGEAIYNLIDWYWETYKKSVIVVWDSIGASLSLETLKADFTDRQPALEAKAITKAVLKIQPIVASTKSIMIVINQVRDKMGAMVFGPTTDTPGGRALKHTYSVRFELKKLKAFTRQGEKFGHHVKFVLQKSKISVPFSNSEALLYGTYGLNELVNAVDTAKDLDDIPDVKKVSGGSKGSLITLPDPETGEVIKVKETDLYDSLATEPEVYFDYVKPIFQKVVKHYFPKNLPYLENENYDLTKLPLLEGIEELYKDKPTEAESENPVEGTNE